jgi:pyruvate ferredoxin oxidoreductase delta subunit
MTAQDKMKNITVETKWQDMTIGGMIFASGNSADFKTGDWRSVTPHMTWDKCKQCLLCVPLCPDSSIPVKEGKRLEFDYDHCKGCGICAKACAFGAIAFGGEE